MRATWWQPVNIESCLATLDFFRDHAEEFGFRDRGYLWLYDDRDLYQEALRMRQLQNSFELYIALVSLAELAKRFPVVDREIDEIIGATFSPRDGLVNSNAVRACQVTYPAVAEAFGLASTPLDSVLRG